MLGLMYYNGEGVEQDYTEAVNWFRKADHIVAWMQADLMYYHGEGVEQDRAEARKWIEKSAETANAELPYQLGVMFRDGDRVEQDYVEAHRWFNLAAEQRHQNACEARDRIEKQMTPAQLAEAQRRAPE